MITYRVTDPEAFTATFNPRYVIAWTAVKDGDVLFDDDRSAGPGYVIDVLGVGCSFKFFSPWIGVLKNFQPQHDIVCLQVETAHRPQEDV